MSSTVYSIGYEGRSLSSFVSELQALGVKSLVDVRLTPMSRKKGFSKGMLEVLLRSRGISYFHERSLGNPPENREPFRSGDVRHGQETFRRLLDGAGAQALQRVASLAREGVVAVLCVEREVEHCHRSVVLEELLKVAPEIEVRAVP